jgi:hypothetical protein
MSAIWSHKAAVFNPRATQFDFPSVGEWMVKPFLQCFFFFFFCSAQRSSLLSRNSWLVPVYYQACFALCVGFLWVDRSFLLY